ncbi:MAG TPA: ABC transporter permease [Candidatus Limiplasma sp.]|nr:ABC transporter permease [Candidatus Limiplasma sp.]HPS80554.1 ABC transporter permease [Candidatus Limiplasma sp.]
MKHKYHKGLINGMASLISIVMGLVFGFALLLIFNPRYALPGFGNLMSAGFTSSEKLAKVFYQSAPLLMTGLSVAFAFKTGLFNIGATGQYTLGAFFSLVAVVQFRLPWWAGILLAMVGGAVMGFIPGVCKALFNVNEVITSIMFNWISLFVVNLSINNMPLLLANAWGAINKDRTAALTSPKFVAYNPNATIPKAGLDQLLGSNYMNIAVFIAILIALIIWLVMNRTTFGYELKACGYNRFASDYAGINAKRNIILSMTIAGALAGIGGGLYYLSGTAQYTIVKSLLAMGFNGIPVALLASSNPLGTIFSALFISFIQVGGDLLQPEYSREIIDIIISVIIYLSAFALLMRGWISKLLMRNQTENVNEELDDSSASDDAAESEESAK